MEDTHLAHSYVVPIAGTDYPINLFGVFDGHSGTSASAYVRDHLPHVLQQVLQEYNPTELTPRGIYNALKMLGVRLHNDFAQTPSAQIFGSGTCLTIALILNGRLYTVNIGDSRIISIDPFSRTITQLTCDQRPYEEPFRTSIQNRGGYVENDRVNGGLAPARAIGDLREKPAVSSRGKVTDHGPIVHGLIIALACDGIWDVATTREIGQAILDHLSEDPAALLRNLLYSCRSSADNLSLMIVRVE